MLLNSCHFWQHYTAQNCQYPPHHILFYHPVLFFPYSSLLSRLLHCVYFHVIFLTRIADLPTTTIKHFCLKRSITATFSTPYAGVEQGQPTIGCKFCCQRMYKHIVVGTGLVWHEPTELPFGEVVFAKKCPIFFWRDWHHETWESQIRCVETEGHLISFVWNNALMFCLLWCECTLMNPYASF